MSILGDFYNVTGDVLPPIQRALQNWDPCTSTSQDVSSTSDNISTQLLTCKDEQGSADFAACIIFFTSPYSVPSLMPWSKPPYSALAKVYSTHKSDTMGIDGVPITSNMSLIEVLDHVTVGGHYESRDFRDPQYYFKEVKSLFF